MENSAIHEIPDLSAAEKRLLRIALYRMSPIYQLTCRNTRNLLRLYRNRGVTKIRVPERSLEDPVSVSFTGLERRLYDAIESEYVRPFYRDYAKAGLPRHGVGFILTIYRKRAASSWAALEKSFRRRLSKLEQALADWGPQSVANLFGSVSLKDLASETAGEADREAELDGIEDDFPEPGKAKMDLEAVRQVADKERYKVRQFLDDLDDLRERETDAKRDAFLSHLRDLLPVRRGMLMFSQYKDTVDAVANSLRYEFGSSMAKHHGDGGEIWEDARWKLVDKKVVEQKVQRGELRLLVATDAASEGLNLQALDAVINYDIPWNPMRIEQRIGRIDRITQESPRISIGVLVPEGTVEVDVYERCVERLGLFKQAIGPMQPVLVENFIKDVVLGNKDVDADWGSLEQGWKVAREHARLFEEALSLQSFGGGWEERRKTEEDALERLLIATGYGQQTGGIWVRGNHRVTLRKKDEDAEWLTALSYDPLFISLLAELGPAPDELESNGVLYRVLARGGSKALAVKHPGGAVFLVKDLANMEAGGGYQVGVDWEAACREIDR